MQGKAVTQAFLCCAGQRHAAQQACARQGATQWCMKSTRRQPCHKTRQHNVLQGCCPGHSVSDRCLDLYRPYRWVHAVTPAIHQKHQQATLLCNSQFNFNLNTPPRTTAKSSTRGTSTQPHHSSWFAAATHELGAHLRCQRRPLCRLLLLLLSLLSVLLSEPQHSTAVAVVCCVVSPLLPTRTLVNSLCCVTRR